MSHRLSSKVEIVKKEPVNLSIAFVDRLIAFYRSQPKPIITPIWGSLIDAYLYPLIDALVSGNKPLLLDILSNCYANNTIAGSDADISSEEYERCFLTVGELYGVIPLFCPIQPWPVIISCEEIIEAVEALVGCAIDHPGAGDVSGAIVGKRFIPNKLLNGLAVLANVLRRDPSGDVLEIGAGCGYIGYLIHKMFPESHYHTMDMPVHSVLQAFLLAGALGEDAIWLEGEPYNGQMVLIHGLKSPNNKFSLVINQDSLPEMPPSVGLEMLKLTERILVTGGLFLSVNQESGRGDQHRVFALIKECPSLKLVNRSPFIYREGWLEEIYIKL